MIRRPPRSTRVRSSAASDVYKRQELDRWAPGAEVRDILDSKCLVSRGVERGNRRGRGDCDVRTEAGELAGAERGQTRPPERAANADSDAAVGDLREREADAGDLRRLRHRDVLHQGQP